jgi:hypothetical protein
MTSVRRLPVIIMTAGLLLTCGGSLLMNQGVRQLGRPVWATGSFIALIGLVSFLVHQHHSRRGKRRGSTADVMVHDQPAAGASLVVALAKLTAIVLVALGVISLGFAGFQFLTSIGGWQRRFGMAYVYGSNGLSTLAMGFGLWLIAAVAGRVETLFAHLMCTAPRKREPEESHFS